MREFEPTLPIASQLMVDALDGVNVVRVYDNETTQQREFYENGKLIKVRPKSHCGEPSMNAPWGDFPDAV